MTDPDDIKEQLEEQNKQIAEHIEEQNKQIAEHIKEQNKWSIITWEIQTYRNNVEQRNLDKLNASDLYVKSILTATIRKMIAHDKRDGSFVLDNQYDLDELEKQLDVKIEYLTGLECDYDYGEKEITLHHYKVCI